MIHLLISGMHLLQHHDCIETLRTNNMLETKPIFQKKTLNSREDSKSAMIFLLYPHHTIPVNVIWSMQKHPFFVDLLTAHCHFLQSSKVMPVRQAANPCALRMSSDNWELTDVGRRNLEDLEGKWKRVCVLGGSRGGSPPSPIGGTPWFVIFLLYSMIQESDSKLWRNFQTWGSTSLPWWVAYWVKSENAIMHRSI